MPSTSDYVRNRITEEIYLPEIDADSCVYALFDDADCHACVDTCPTQAWILGEDALSLDTSACDGCGLCVPSCPSGALHVHFPWAIRSLGGHMIALFACEQTGIRETDGVLPCIHALGLRQLLLLYNSGIEYLLTATDDCSDCPRHQSGNIHQRLDELNKLLRERHKAPMKISRRSTGAWTKVFGTDELITRGTLLSRREFLRGGERLLHHQLVVMDPLNLAECRTVPPGQLLPTTTKNKAHWPWAPQLDERRCSGCDACVKLCPTDALVTVQQEDDATPGYHLDPASCNGCGICAAVCESEAIFVESWSLAASRTIQLLEKRCTACGNTYHLPRHSSLSEEPICRVCQKHNHSGNLYQVLTEN